MADQTSQYYAILTNVGAAKQANADALGVAWKITHMGIGDANGTEPLPSPTQTRLINEKRRAPLNALSVDPGNAAVIVAEQILPAEIGGFWIRELGLYDSDGALVAIANCPPSFKPLLAQGSGRTQTVRINLIVSNSATVELKIDPTVVMASRAYVDQAVAAEINKLDHKKSVRVATTANITLSGLQAIDGVTVVAGDRVLVKNQSSASQNGLYTAATGSWPRTADADSNVDVTPMLEVGVEAGTTNADTFWFLSTNAPITVGATALAFQQWYTAIQVDALLAPKAPLASPALTGTPTAPTAVAGSNTTQLANTAFVQAAMALFGLGTASAKYVADVDALEEGGCYHYLATSSINGPEAANSTVLHLPWSNASAGCQIFMVMTVGTSRLYFRTKASSVWSAWQQFGRVDSPALIGTPTAPTANSGTSTAQLATTAFVQNAIAALVGAAPATLNQLNELAAALGNDANFSATMASQMGLKAPTASPALTGTPTAPTASVGTDSPQLATMAALLQGMAAYGVGAQIAPLIDDLDTIKKGGLYRANNDAANLPFASSSAVLHLPHSTTAAVQIVGVFSSTANARLFWRSSSSSVWSSWREVGKLDSPALTGTPTAPTAAEGNSSNQLATTAFVQAAMALFGVGTLTPDLVPDVNVITKSGMYRTNASALNTPYPAPFSLLHMQYNAGAGCQLLCHLTGTGATTRLFWRTSVGSTWTVWKEVGQLDSPALIGAPTAPTASYGTSSTQLATTAFVQAAIAGLVGSAPTTLNQLSELAEALGNDANFSTTVLNQLANKAPLVSPALIGTPTAPTAAVGTETDQIATMKALKTTLNTYGIGTPDAPDLATGIDLDTVRTGGFYQVNGAVNAPGTLTGGLLIVVSNATYYTQQLFMPQGGNRMFQRCSAGQSMGFGSWREIAQMESPALSGTPTAPTAALGTNTAQLATTAFVQTVLSTVGLGSKAPTVSDLNALRGTCFFGFAATAVGAVPGASYDAIGWQVEAVGQRTQFAVLAHGTLWFRTDDSTDYSGFADWVSLAPTDSPTFTGTPTAPTASVGTDTDQIATMKAVKAALNTYGIGTPDIPDTLLGTDLDTLRVGGFYQVSGAVNAPGTLTSGIVLVASNATYYTQQLFMPQGGNRLFQRCSAGQAMGFGSWREIAQMESPAFSGTPTAPTAAVNTSTTQLATTAFVQTVMSSVGLGNKAPNVTDLNALRGACFFGFSATATGAVPGTGYDAIGWQVEAAGQRTQFAVSVHGTLWFRTDDSNDYSGFTDWASLALSDSPTFTGTPKAPTPAVGDSGTAIATTSFVQQALAAIGLGTSTAPLVSDCDALTTSGFYFTTTTGTANGPLAASGFLLHMPWNGTSAMLQIYATASADRFFWRTKSSGTWRAWKESANLDSPAFSGVPTAPTAAAGTNSTQLATMAALQQGLAANGLGVIGNTVTVTNVDDYTQPTGLWRTIGGTSPTTGTFPAGISAYGTLFIERYSTTGVKQTFSPNANAAGAGTTWERFYTGTAWLEWIEVIKRTSKLDASMINSGMLPPARLEHITGGSDWVRLNGDPNNSEVGGSIRVGSSGTPYITLNGTTILAWGASGELLTGSVPWSKVTGGPSEAGMVSMFAMASAPSGYLKANGAAVSRTTYSVLFAAIGTTYGTGNGSTTFNLPDLRAEFIRGLDDGRNIDTGRVIGSAQGSQNAEHNHVASSSSSGAHTHTVNVKGDRASGEGNQVYGDEDFYKDPLNLPTTSAGAHTHTISVSPSGGPEARPRNIALLACIRYL